jgi:MYXO-CTERM domain-containing protein
MTKLSLIIAAVSLTALAPAIASAQSTTDGTTSTVQMQKDVDHFPWGLLGLLGLAGLIPRKRAVHVDARTNR